jgi:putative addiction module component (TIGR02574 family)
MSRNEALRTAVLALPEEERADLAVDLIDSLDGPADPHAEEAWANEISARLAARRAGQAAVVPFETALAVAYQARHG